MLTAVLSGWEAKRHFCVMADSAKYDRLNESVAGWAKVQSRSMRRLVAQMSLKDKHALRKRAWAKANEADYKSLEKSLGFGLKKDAGQVSRVNFRMVRHGVFYERGVGKGRKAGASNTRPHPFIKPTLDPAIDQLAEIIASEYADLAVGEIKFVVPGIISRRIKIQNNG